MKFNIEIKENNTQEEVFYVSTEINNIFAFFMIDIKDGDIEIAKTISYFVIEKVMLNPVYSKNNFSKILNDANLELINLKEKDINNKLLKASISFLMSDYNTYIVENIGDIKFLHIRNNTTINQNIENILSYDLYKKEEIEKDDIYVLKYSNILTNFFGDKFTKISYEYQLNPLEKDDDIFLLNIKYTKKYMEKLNFDFNNPNNSIAINLKLTEKSEISLYQEKSLNFKKIGVIFLITSIILIYLYHNYSLSKEILDIKFNIKRVYQTPVINLKKVKIEEIKNEVSKLTNDKRMYIYIGKYKELLNEKSNLEKESETYTIINESIENVLKVNEKDFNNSIPILEKEYTRLKDIKTKLNIAEIIKIIENKISRSNKYKEVFYKEEEANKYIKSEKYELAVDLYDEIIKIYTELGEDSYIKNNIFNKINEIREKLYILNTNIDELEREYLKFKDIKYKLSLDILTKLLEEYLKTSNEEKIIETQKRKDNIMKKINEVKSNIDVNIKLANKYYNNQKYVEAIEIYNNLFDEINRIEDNNLLKEIKNRIYNIQLKIRTKNNISNNLKILEENKKIKQEQYIISKKLISEGDNYLKNNEFDKSLEKYIKALKLVEKDDSLKEYIEQINKKINYIEKNVK